jgi:hypothetical protein
MSASQFLEHHGTVLLAKGGAASVGTLFLAGMLPHTLGALLALVGILSAFCLGMAGFALSLFFLIRRLPLKKVVLPGAISIGIGTAMTFVAVLNSVLHR